MSELFRLTCTSEEQKESLYWICFALWQGHYFRHELIGSVIEFIRIKETFNLINKAFLKNQNNPELFQKALTVLKTVNDKDLHFQDLAATLKKIKREVARDLVR